MAVSKGKAKGKSGVKGEDKKGFGFISVPKDLGAGDLMVMSGTCTAQLAKIHYGTSQTGNPKATLEFVLTSEIDDVNESMGAKVLENCSLLPQALWKLNDYYKQVVGEDIPQGDYSQEEFKEIIADIIGSDWSLELREAEDDKGNKRTEIGRATISEE